MKVILLISNNQTSPFIHKHQTPATLHKFGGKFLLEYLINELLLITEDDIQEIIFVTSAEITLFHDTLKQIATKLNLKTTVYTCLKGDSPLDALACASEGLNGPVLVIPSNAWFKGGNTISSDGENMVLVQKVEDPSEHNVVKLEMNNAIAGFHKKSYEYISDLSPVGGCFFKKSETLLQDIQQLLSDGLEDEVMSLNHLVEYRIKKGDQFLPSLVEGWITCDTIDAIIEIHKILIAGFTTHRQIDDTAEIKNTVIISPVYIGENVKISNSVVGPNVSIGSDAMIDHVIVSDALIAENAQIENVKLTRSILGQHAIYKGKTKRINLSDYSYLKE